MLALFKYFNFVFFKHYHIDTPRSLKSLIIEVKVIMKLDSKHKAADKQAMYVEPTESKTLKINVPVHDHNGHDETFRGEAGEFMDSPEVVFERDVGDVFGIKYGG